jgi:NAD(P)-dependent dehydrogenase (short-subunit alcohol dehydrogenase family)
LRNGGKVIGTTRYPHFAISNYAKEPDYNMWKSNLSIIKCDFLNIESVYKLLDIITSNNYQINAFINMAFRTVKASTFYSDAVKSIETNLEKQFYLENEQLNNFTDIVTYNGTQNKQILFDNDLLLRANTNALVTYQMPVKINIFRDVVDTKLECSWDKTIDKIDPKEIVECTAINQLVPTLIINSLKSKLVGSFKTIINICSFEGQFDYNKKTDKHIHTNMCKSALNMLIRSLSEDLDSEFRAFAIDPGYVSGKKTDPNINELPVSMHDAAAKITWPIFRQLNGNPLPKDFVKIRNYNKEKW